MRGRGQAMVEFALGLPLLLVILIGLLEVGIAVMKYSIVSNVARDGARYAATMTGIDTARWKLDCNIGQVGTGRTYAVAACPPDASLPETVVAYVARKAVGLDSDQIRVTITYEEDMNGFNRGRPISVKVDYAHQLMLGRFAPNSRGEERIFYLLPSTVNIQSSSRMLAE
jgi:Flp pilus assembly protein TadG